MLMIETFEESVDEAKRQVEICNACRYCESYCSVFPAISRERAFSDENITQLANLCHNCRACYHACQYTEPHEFAINLPKVLAEVRQESWQHHAKPAFVASLFHRHGSAIAATVILGFALFIWLCQTLTPTVGEGFYGILSHNVMISLFIPAFLLPILSIIMSLRGYWRTIGGERIRLTHILGALGSIATMKNLAGGHGDGCNFEEEDRFSHTRRVLHQMVMYGFLLCFAATSVATIMHYVFNLSAPYGLFSLPKILGLSGGVLLCMGTVGMAISKIRADKNLADTSVWGGEMAFVLLLFFVSITGLLLYWLGDSAWLPELLATHLGAVFAFFLLMPYSKMLHGFYRLAALLHEEQKKNP
jgi:citrate/tricarballylate utilization protein